MKISIAFAARTLWIGVKPGRLNLPDSATVSRKLNHPNLLQTCFEFFICFGSTVILNVRKSGAM